MKKTLLLIALVAIAPIAFSQITLTNSNTVTVGTNLHRSEDLDPNIAPGSAGANQTWDFSGLNAYTTTFDSIEIKLPSAVAIHGDSFPNADFSISSTDGTNLFTESDANSIRAVGLGGPFDLNGFPLEVTLPFNNPQTLLEFPTTYLTNFEDTLFFDLFKDSVAEGLVDSARIKRIQTIVSNVDAWGTVTTPLGTFSALRESRVEASTDSLWAESELLGFTFDTLALTQVDTELVYNWYSESYNLPIVEIRTKTNGDIKTVFFLLDSADCCVDVSIEENPLAKKFSVYPNPTSTFINVITTFEEPTIVSILDMTGRLVFTNQINQAQNRLDISGLASGMYVYRIEDLTGELIKSEKIQIQ